MSENKKKRKQRNKEKPKKANKMKTAQHEEEEGSKRLPHSGPGDDSLLLAVRTGTFQDVERVLNSQEDGDVCSQAAVDQALCIASARGHVLYVTSLLAAGADVNWRDQENNTSLLLSAERRFVHIVRLLVGAGADINVRNSEGATPLMLAIHPSGSNDLARLLVNSSNVNIKDNSGRTALMKATEAGDVDTIQLLLKSGASLKDCDNNGHTVSDISKNNGLDNYLSLFSDKVGVKLPLFKAVEMRNLTLIKNIITMNKQMVTQQNDKFETALQHFLKTIQEDGIKATTNDLSIIEYLLKAQRNIKNSKQKFTNSSSKNPVQLACLIGDDNILLLLLKYGAELDTTSYDDEDKPLMIAAKCGHATILEILLAKGSKIHRRSLQLAVKNGHTDCAQILLDAFAKTNTKDAAHICIEECDVSLLRYLTETFNIEIQDKYFLWVAIARGNKEIVNFLIERGADVNATFQGHFRLSWKKSTRLFTPMCHAAYHKHTEVLKTLLASGADTGGVDDDGNTALFYCVENDDIDGTRQLLEAGAIVNHRNIKGYTPLLYALAKKCGKTESYNYNTKGVTAALISMVRLLIGYGADVNISNNENITCLLLLSSYSAKENIDILKILIEQGAHLDACDAGGNTALILASKCRNVKMMKELLHAGAKVNAQNFDSKTALSSIFQYERYNSIYCEALDLLLSYGGVLSGVKSRTAVYTLIQDSIDQHENVVKILGKGVYPYTFVNESGSSLDFYIPSDLEAVTPVSYALVRKKPDTAKYLFSKNFLTLYDVQTIQHSKQFRDYLVKCHVTSIDVYDAIFGQPLTLFTLSFVVVSASLGVDFDRQERVNRLPIPQAIKRKLLFQDL